LLVNITDFQIGDAFNAPAHVLVDLPTLINWIQTSVAPGTWVAPPALAADPQAEVPAGIRVGTIEVLETWGAVLIRQTADIHAEIENFLDTLAQTVNELMVVSLEMRILTLDDATLEKIGVQWKGLDIAGESFVDEGAVSNRSDLTSDLRFGSQPPLPLLGALDTGAVATIDYSIIRDWAARVVVELAQKIQGSEAVQAPSITLMQNQLGYISLNDLLPYVSELTTDVSEDAVGITPTIATVAVGITFQALATISTDRKYVYLTVAPTFTDLKGFVTSSALAVTGNTSSEIEQTIPIITTTDVRTTVKVPDGGTLVLGGFVRSSQTDAESRVPILSHIPIFGNLFRSHGKGGNRTTIILMITPHIVDYAEYEAEIEFYGEIAPSRTPKPAEPVESVGTFSIGD
jgi:general secretion pathway protein D